MVSCDWWWANGESIREIELMIRIEDWCRVDGPAAEWWNIIKLEQVGAIQAAFEDKDLRSM